MELILPVLSSTASYFFLAYFIYIISGRKKGLTKGILYILGLVMLYQNVIRPWGLLTTPGLIYAIIVSITPPLLSLLLLSYLMGDFRIRSSKFKQTKLKDLKESIDTIYYQMKFVYLALIIPILFIIFALLILESFLLYSTILLSIAVFIYGIITWYKLKNIKQEVLILCIGKDKEKIYSQPVKPKTNHIQIKTYYHNDNYLIDQLGYLDIMDGKKTERHHLYWIGTSDKVIIDDPSWKINHDLPYQNNLASFEKYHYVHATYLNTEQGIKQTQFKRIK
ncbi:MAG: hypothetical protein V3569_01530 [Acholeplasmataceae bacterium]|nr:hypothetical protein [Acholeplasmataceae bacterium]